MAKKQTLALIGVPSSAGAHWPGQEKAPGYLRNAGLITRLETIGFKVDDYGDLPLVMFQPDKNDRRRQNLEAVVSVANTVADKVELALKHNSFPVVIGGDCTIGLGVIAGFLRHEEETGLLYFDGHVDLNTPADSRSGILDSMGVAHMIGKGGTAKELSNIGNRFPLIPEDQIVLFGYNPLEINRNETEAISQYKFRHYSISEVQKAIKKTAVEAVKYLESELRSFIVHFDVDVIDFTDLPVADVPQFSKGLMFSEVIECLTVFASGKKFGGLVITEFNPDHAESDNTAAKTFIKGLTEALNNFQNGV